MSGAGCGPLRRALRPGQVNRLPALRQRRREGVTLPTTMGTVEAGWS